MEPIKLEDNLREKLQERELEPSKDAWNTLAGQLDEEEGIQPKRTYFWYAIAASFIGVLIIASFLFKDSMFSSEETVDFVDENTEEVMDEERESPGIHEEVEINKIASEEIDAEEIVEAPELVKEKKVNTIVARVKTSVSEEKKNTPLVHDKAIILKEKTNALSVIASETNKKELEENVEKGLIKKQSLMDTKVSEVVAQIQEMKEKNELITDQEIDALLANAQKEIRLQELLNSTKIDAASLLLGVEEELERSFRDKVYEALGDGYRIIRTAVSDRNY